MKIEQENSLKKVLKNGLSLFCGAGFSVEARNKDNIFLPCGNNFLTYVKKRFPSVGEYSELTNACTFLESTENDSFHNFITDFFSVGYFNPVYKELLQLPIKNIFTTNVDNLWFKIFENSNNKYLNNLAKNGSIYEKRDLKTIDYYALHGCVEIPGKPYIFSKIDLVTAFSEGNNSWKALGENSKTEPILFWGWNFNDPAPLQAMYRKSQNINENQAKWFLLYDKDNIKKENIDILKVLGFNIIYGSTQDLLEYIKAFNNETKDSSDSFYKDNIKIDDEKYCIPNQPSITSVPLDVFFCEYSPRWSHIYSNQIPKTHHYKTIANIIDSGKNSFVIGLRGCGKTTIMMQLLKDFDSSGRKKHFLIAPNIFDVEIYLKTINTENVLLFIDDALQDVDALEILFKHKNIQIVAFERDFDYESQFHKLEKYELQIIDISEINKTDAQSILKAVPKTLLKDYVSTNVIDCDPTIPNLFVSNFKNINFGFFDKFYEKDSIAAEVFLLICYVHSCGVPCSFDMVYSYLGDENYSWEDMQNILDKSGKLIKENDFRFIGFTPREIIQDYYSCRSRFFAEKIVEKIEHTNSNEILRNVLKKFASNVPLYKICNYKKFKKKCIDADMTNKIFPIVSEGIDFYKLWIEKDENEYVYQQAALYLAKKKEYQDAFLWIDKAKSISQYNRFSVQSTYAQIWFDSNYDKDEKQLLLQSLNQLEECCKNDKKTRAIHFIHYVEKVDKFLRKYGFAESKGLIDSALKYIDIGLNPENFELSKYHKNRLKKYQRKFIDLFNKS